MRRIVFTKHAARKFSDFAKMGWKVRRTDVRNAILYPNKGPADSGYGGTTAVLKKLDDKHNLRVIYVQQGDIIKVITFYPVERGRYEQKQETD